MPLLCCAELRLRFVRDGVGKTSERSVPELTHSLILAILDHGSRGKVGRNGWDRVLATEEPDSRLAGDTTGLHHFVDFGNTKLVFQSLLSLSHFETEATIPRLRGIKSEQFWDWTPKYRVVGYFTPFHTESTLMRRALLFRFPR